MKRINLLVIVVLALTALGIGTASASTDTVAQTRTARAADTIILGTTDAISKLDPADAYSYHDWEILRNTNEGLLRLTPGTTEIEPAIAAAMPTVSEDGLTYTFELKPDLKFADGTPYGAEEVAASVNRVMALNGDPAAPLVTSFVSKVEAVDGKVVFTLNAAFDLFPLLTTTPPYVVINPADYPADAINNFPTQINGNGAYSLVSYTSEEQAVFAANPNYHGTAAVTPNIIIRYYKDSPQLSLALESGEVDVAMRTLSPTELDTLRNNQDISIISAPGRIIYMIFQHAMAPGDDINVRKGFAYAIDRDEIVDRALGGSYQPLYSMIPPGFLGADEAFLDTYGFADPQAAAAEFAKSGYTADNPLVLDLWYPPEHYGDQMVDVVTIVKEQLEATGVVQVNLQVAEWSTYVEAATSGDYPIFMFGWFFDYPDSSNYIDPFAQCGASDSLGVFYCNDQMDALILKGRSEVADPATREQTYVDIQQLYADEVVTLPVYVATENYAYRNNVAGVVYGSALEFRFASLSKEE